jgi:peptidoglycan/xylan/chitin deacetylase (PgdA/CDA1 family)
MKKKKINFWLLFIASSAAMLVSFNFKASWAQAASLDKAIVTITLDDGYQSLYKYALPILKKYSFPATCYITSDFVGDGSHVTWSQLKTLKGSYSWEIGNHTKSHEDLLQLTDQEIISQVKDAENAFENNGLNNVAAFAPPFGDFDQRVVDILKGQGYITSNREAWTEETAFNTVASFDPWSLNISSLESDKMNYTKAKNLIDQAVYGKKWLIFVLHDIVPGTPTNPYQFKATELQKIVDYLGILSKQKKLQIVTTSAGVAKMKSFSK